jgi:hypothetical protein
MQLGFLDLVFLILLGQRKYTHIQRVDANNYKNIGQ